MVFDQCGCFVAHLQIIIDVEGIVVHGAGDCADGSEEDEAHGGEGDELHCDCLELVVLV